MGGPRQPRDQPARQCLGIGHNQHPSPHQIIKANHYLRENNGEPCNISGKARRRGPVACPCVFQHHFQQNRIVARSGARKGVFNARCPGIRAVAVGYGRRGAAPGSGEHDNLSACFQLCRMAHLRTTQAGVLWGGRHMLYQGRKLECRKLVCRDGSHDAGNGGGEQSYRTCRDGSGCFQAICRWRPQPRIQRRDHALLRRIHVHQG